MSISDFLNFDLLLHGGGDAYVARVLSSDVTGDAASAFYLPFDQNQLYTWLGRINQIYRDLRPPTDQAQQSSLDAREFGQLLFETVFAGEVGQALTNSYAIARHQQQGLRIRLRVARDAPELAEIPWEYLYAPEWDRFLVTADETPLVRYVESPSPPQALAVRLPLHILAVVADPRRRTASPGRGRMAATPECVGRSPGCGQGNARATGPTHGLRIAHAPARRAGARTPLHRPW